MTDTPRTDALADRMASEPELEALARTLERELAAARAELAAEKKLGVATSRDCNQVALERNDLRAEVARLREALQRIMYARCDPASPITNMSRAGMRELAAAALGLPTE